MHLMMKNLRMMTLPSLLGNFRNPFKIRTDLLRDIRVNLVYQGESNVRRVILEILGRSLQGVMSVRVS